MGPRAGYVLVVVLPQIVHFLVPTSVVNHHILQVIYHLVLRSRLDLKWRNAALMFEESTA